MAVAYGTRINDDTNFITEIDLDNNTCETTGYINGEAVDFSGGGGSGLNYFVPEQTVTSDNEGQCVLSGVNPPENDCYIFVKITAIGESDFYGVGFYIASDEGTDSFKVYGGNDSYTIYKEEGEWLWVTFPSEYTVTLSAIVAPW